MAIDQPSTLLARAKSTVAAVLVLFLCGLLLAPRAGASSARPASGPLTPTRTATTPPPPPIPKAWVLVDVGSGQVLDAGNDRVPLPPASLTKLLTAVIAAQTLAPSDTLVVSDRAAGEPARKIGMVTGQVWTFKDALYCLLLSSANDAAAAIGERVGGSLEQFSSIMVGAAQTLGLADSPVLHDPAGLDDNFSVDGGNLLSARDLAIIARAALSQPFVAAAMGTDIYRFVGPDGTHHRLLNHIHTFLETYPGAIGGKPGYTAKAGSGVILAATRNGRTLLAVTLDTPNPYASADALLDKGWSMPATGGTGDVLPPVHLPGPHGAAVAPAAATGSAPVAAHPPLTAALVHRPSGSPAGTYATVALLLLVAGTAVAGRRRQVRRRRAVRLAARRSAGGQPW